MFQHGVRFAVAKATARPIRLADDDGYQRHAGLQAFLGQRAMASL